MMKIITFFVVVCLLLYVGSSGEYAQAEELPKKVALDLAAQYVHDAGAYCQGLVYQYDEVLQKDVLYESTGRYGQSELRKVELTTGKTLKSVSLPSSFFGEGLAFYRNRWYQLTWQEHLCLVYDASFKQVDEFRYSKEGWGLTVNDKEFIFSDGSATLTFLDPASFRPTRRLNVYIRRDGKKFSLPQLNELEWIEGEIWANIYQTTYIVRINPKSGEVIDTFDCRALVPEHLRGNTEFVLNGIAFDAKNRRIFITGKCWPIIYEFKMR